MTASWDGGGLGFQAPLFLNGEVPFDASVGSAGTGREELKSTEQPRPISPLRPNFIRGGERRIGKSNIIRFGRWEINDAKIKKKLSDLDTK
jgi:hypothetical protein